MKKIKKLKTTKNYLALAGISLAVFILSVFLHNFFYAMEISTRNKPVFRFIFETLSAIFFLVAVPLAPLGFSIGFLGASTLIIKKLLKRK